MTNSTSKAATPGLIHHPSAVLDDLCSYDADNHAWSDFDQHLTAELRALEEKFRPFWTQKAVRQSLGR